MRETSRAALDDAIARGSLSAARRRVYDALVTHGAMTGAELDAKLGGKEVRLHFHKRLSELRSLGYAKEVGTRICSVTGHVAISWQADDGAPRTLPPPPKRDERCGMHSFAEPVVVGSVCRDCKRVVTEVDYQWPGIGRVVLVEARA